MIGKFIIMFIPSALLLICLAIYLVALDLNFTKIILVMVIIAFLMSWLMARILTEDNDDYEEEDD